MYILYIHIYAYISILYISLYIYIYIYIYIYNYTCMYAIVVNKGSGLRSQRQIGTGRFTNAEVEFKFDYLLNLIICWSKLWFCMTEIVNSPLGRFELDGALTKKPHVSHDVCKLLRLTSGPSSSYWKKHCCGVLRWFDLACCQPGSLQHYPQ